MRHSIGLLLIIFLGSIGCETVRPVQSNGGTHPNTRTFQFTYHAEVEEIPDNASLDSWEGWDSLVHMRLILSMEAQLGHELQAETIVNISCLEDVARCLSK